MAAALLCLSLQWVTSLINWVVENTPFAASARIGAVKTCVAGGADRQPSNDELGSWCLQGDSS
jgi:hypothetical protein